MGLKSTQSKDTQSETPIYESTMCASFCAAAAIPPIILIFGKSKPGGIHAGWMDLC